MHVLKEYLDYLHVIYGMTSENFAIAKFDKDDAQTTVPVSQTTFII